MKVSNEFVLRQVADEFLLIPVGSAALRISGMISLTESGYLLYQQLQSGCDRTLKAMNRKYDTAHFYRAVEALRQYFPGCALTCDLITGFPGETDADQAETLAFIEKCGFSDMHIFPYSRRPGTPADTMPGQNSNAVKSARAHEANEVAKRMHEQFMDGSVGLRLPVLFETEEDGFSVGHSDTYVLVKVPGTGLRGKLCTVEIQKRDGEKLLGRVLDASAEPVL